jgi:hypothetical protein
LDRVLIYDGQQAQLPPVPACERQKIQVSHASLPDPGTIQRLMAIIDPRLPFVGNCHFCQVVCRGFSCNSHAQLLRPIRALLMGNQCLIVVLLHRE